MMKMNKIRIFLSILIYFAILFCTACSTSNQGNLTDGNYTAEVIMEGGSGRASIESPTTIMIKDGQIYATIIWSSPNYDYMIVDDEKYINECSEGNSRFTILITGFEESVSVIANTVAMSTPHEIEYTLVFELVE